MGQQTSLPLLLV